MSKIGFLGGTFDPIHVGHLHMAEVSYKEMNLDKIIFLPNALPPHKENKYSSYIDRCNMIKLAIKNDGRFDISYIEKEPKVHYTAETVKVLSKLYSKDRLFFIIGEDSLISFDTWYKPKDILKYVDLIVVPRTNMNNNEYKELEKAAKKVENIYKGNVYVIKSDSVILSSTEIRNSISEGKNIDGLVAKEVKEYILKNKLYVKKR